jgi:hypothetical protein
MHNRTIKFKEKNQFSARSYQLQEISNPGIGYAQREEGN